MFQYLFSLFCDPHNPGLTQDMLARPHRDLPCHFSQFNMCIFFLCKYALFSIEYVFLYFIICSQISGAPCPETKYLYHNHSYYAWVLSSFWDSNTHILRQTVRQIITVKVCVCENAINIFFAMVIIINKVIWIIF